MKIYIAGKITGLDYEDALDEFVRAENRIAFLGHMPLNPMKLVDQTEGRTYNEYLADALVVMLTQSEGVYFLENWADSKGAVIEFYISKTLKIPMYFGEKMLPKS